MNKLRILRVLVQVETVWDDGEELTPGPGIEPVALPYSDLAGFVDNLPGKLAEIAGQLDGAEPSAPSERSSDDAGGVQ